MKKTLLLSAFFLALITIAGSQKTDAQVTGIAAFGGLNYNTSNCILPDTAYFVPGASFTGPYLPTDSVTFYVNFGDGSDTTYKLWDSSGAYASLKHIYTLPGNYTWYFSAITTGSLTSSLTAPTPLTLSNSCANVQGHTYLDANSNCVRDAGDYDLGYTPIMLVYTATADTTFEMYANDTGFYEINLLPNNYELYTINYSGGTLVSSCPASGTYTLSPTSSGSITENYGYGCTGLTTYDVRPDGWSGTIVRGDSSFTVNIALGDYWWGGATCASLSSTITLTLDPHLHYLPAYSHLSMAPTSVVGNTLMWNLTTVSDHFRLTGNLKVYCDLTTTTGAILTNTITATPTSLTDPNLTNNTQVFNTYVVSSFDPNEMEVSPQGTGTPGYIVNNTPLSYSIHFQNTGTAPAENISINDTLDASLDPRTFHIVSSSYPVEVYMKGNAIKFRLDGINLPDSTGNPNTSIGNIVYAVMPKSGLAVGTQIKNKANIFFDYNPGVLTNTALNTIMSPTGVNQVVNANFKAIVYPNPANNQVIAKTDDKSEFTITMTDMLGRTVATGNSMNGNAALGTQSLAPGIYIVKLINTDGKEVTTKLVVQH